MKLLFASDFLKGSLSAMDICDVPERVTQRHFPGVGMLFMPVASGGEGTVDALLRAWRRPAAFPMCPPSGGIPKRPSAMVPAR